MTLRTFRLVGTPLVSVVALCALSVLGEGTAARTFAQTFRASVDLIAVDVQVVDKSGRPVTTLGPDKFAVTLDGRKRRVASATFTKYEMTPLGAGPRQVVGTSPAGVAGAPGGVGRTFILAIDTASFRTLDVRVATLAAERFTQQILPEDTVGLVTLPYGPKVAPTTSHALVRQALATVVGRKQLDGAVEMSVDQVVDITATIATSSLLDGEAKVQALISDTGDMGDAGASTLCKVPTQACTDKAMNEAQGLATSLEQDLLQGLAGLDALLKDLQQSPGRKTVIFLSGGMPVSDKSGGRPALGDEVKRLGEQAAYANATINTIYFDPSTSTSGSAGSRKPQSTAGRIFGINTRALSEFSDPSGGTLIQSSTGAGEREIDRILSEISTYYILGIEPDDRDRDGRPHQLGVKVDQKDVTIRSRHLVVVPKTGK